MGQQPPKAPLSDGSTGPVSMEQLFSILMQHQQIIQNGTVQRLIYARCL